MQKTLRSSTPDQSGSGSGGENTYVKEEVKA
jgi:hypothetical protein